MNGLDKIKDKILDEAKIKADGIISKATDEAKKMIQQAETQSQQDAQEIREEGKKKADAAIRFAESSAHLEGRKKILETKGQIIDSVIKEAYRRMVSLDDSDYFTIITRLVMQYAHNDEGEMYFSSNDLKRMPKDYETKLNEQLKQGKLKISSKPYNIDAGFILVYGGIEENCSFNALFKAQNDILRDKISAILFA